MDEQTRICDYEESDYRTAFWDGQGRDYEDLAERIALRRLLPPRGRRLLDIGGGFGRLAEFYQGYEQVVLLDYSTSLLRQAQDRLGRDGRVVYVAASFYQMPFGDDQFDAAMMVRVMHHVAQVPRLLAEVARVLVANRPYVLEFANKRHLKSILRYFLRRQTWNPFDREPYELSEMHFNFHPTWMQQRLAEAGFHVKRRLTVSHFRLPWLKRRVPAPTLARLDGLCQPTGAWWQLTPSIFGLYAVDKPAGEISPQLRFRCPACRCEALQPSSAALACPDCGRRWPIEDGIYNLKPV